MAENTPKWQEDLCYSTSTFHKHVVNGKEQNFYPVSVGLLFKLRKTAKEVTKALSKLFANTTKDVKQIDSTTTGKDNAVERTVVIEPIDLHIATYRDNQIAEAWSGTIDAITDDATLGLVAEIIMDSMADVFPKDANGNVQGPSASDFIKATKLPTLAQMVFGVAKGNQDVFGPLGSKVSSLLSNLEKLAASKLTELAEQKAKETQTQTDPTPSAN